MLANRAAIGEAMIGDRDDAQAVFEKKALESVRNLVDTIEEEDRTRSSRAFKRTAIIAVVVLLAVGAAMLAGNFVKTWMKKPEVVKETRTMSSAQYVEQALAKIERLSNTRNKPGMTGYYGRVQVNIVIGVNGFLKDFEVTNSSGDSKLDGMVTRQIKLSEPFGALPAEVKADFLEIKRIYRVDRSASGDSKLSIEGAPI
jgi:outer membrane biosynthesis protein TonB